MQSPSPEGGPLLRLDPDTIAVETLTLRDIPVGGQVRISGFDLPAGNTRRLLEMGFTTGTLLEVIRFAPLGDPVEVRVRGYHLSLRRIDAAGILVSPPESR